MKFNELVEITLSTDAGLNPLNHKNTRSLFGGKLIRRRLGSDFEPFIKIKKKENKNGSN
jgi:hypothetical protein